MKKLKMNYDRKKIVKKIIELSSEKNEGHIPSSLSIIDILYVIYNKIVDIDKIKKGLPFRDRFILSKGHASLGLYVILDEIKLLNDKLKNFCNYNSTLGGHPTTKEPFIETSTGSLGHGLPISVGMAMSYKIQNFKENIYVLIGDGESNEGTVWESALLASHHNLNNLYCIMDYNHSGDRALNIDSILSKFESFGWDCLEINGHDLFEIENSLNYKSDKPIFILANTIKGKGCKIMENNPEWHHKSPSEKELKEILNHII